MGGISLQSASKSFWSHSYIEWYIECCRSNKEPSPNWIPMWWCSSAAVDLSTSQGEISAAEVLIRVNPSSHNGQWAPTRWLAKVQVDPCWWIGPGNGDSIWSTLVPLVHTGSSPSQACSNLSSPFLSPALNLSCPVTIRGMPGLQPPKCTLLQNALLHFWDIKTYVPPTLLGDWIKPQFFF